MRTRKFLMLGGILLATGLPCLAACASPEAAQAPGDYEKVMGKLQRARDLQPTPVSPDLNVIELEGNAWIHRSYIRLGDQRLHANGLILVSSDGITIIDAPWTPMAAYDLLDWLDAEFDMPVRRLVVTHAHEDRIGGIEPFIERNVAIYASRTTADIARRQGWSAPNFLFEDDLPIRSGGQAIELFHPGPGHSTDNIVAWIADARILFGGCMVKSRHAESLGFTGDADMAAWPASIERAMQRYPDVEMIIPGHGQPGDRELAKHTLELLRN